MARLPLSCAFQGFEKPPPLHRVLLPQSTARVNPQTYNSIKALTEDPDTVVVIFSGSAKARFRV